VKKVPFFQHHHRHRMDAQHGGYQLRPGLERPRYRVAGRFQDLLG
jgi:hypothetical protein